MLQLVRIIVLQRVDKSPHVNVKVLSTHDDNVRSLDHNISCCREFVEIDASDTAGLAGGTIDMLRRQRVLVTSLPSCGPGKEQADSDILWQKTYSGKDADGVNWVINYSVIVN